MPLKRSRPQTEQKFKDAVLDLVADSGCGAIGVNAIAQKAGADKVLIYRYFDNLHGLLQTVAQQQKWLPQCEELVESLGTECNHAVGYLQNVFQALVKHIRSEPSIHQVMRWRYTTKNPLTDTFTKQWNQLWSDVSMHFKCSSSATTPEEWSHACTLLALLIEAEINGNSVDPLCIQTLAGHLPALKVDASPI